MQKWEELAYARDEGREEGREIGLKSLVNMAKNFCDDFESLYKAIIKSEEYRDVTREQVMKYYS